jgi:hypothetical protein
MYSERIVALDLSMKIQYKNRTYDFCPQCCVQCIHYLGRGWCSLFPDIQYSMGKRIRPVETLDVFEL